MKLIKKRCGKYKKKKDQSMGFHSHQRPDGSLFISERDIVGMEYEIESEEFVEAQAIRTYVYPHGEVVESEIAVDSKGSWAMILQFNKQNMAHEGKYEFKVRLKDQPEQEISQTFKIYNAFKNMIFGETKSNLVEKKDIEEFEQKEGVRFCEDYKNFLLNRNGLFFSWWWSSEFAHLIKEKSFIKKVNAVTDFGEWIYETRALFGLYNQTESPLEVNIACVAKEYREHFYPIGDDGGGNILVQFAQGSKKGELAMMDHEVMGIMDDLKTVENGKYVDAFGIEFKTRFMSFKEATTDQLVEDLCDSGVLSYYPVSFESFIRDIYSKHEEAYKKLKQALEDIE